MNEFIEQFLLESRELVEQASADLLALEENPIDRARLDSAFRAVHTLKGAAGIVDFAAMARALHAAEDGLSRVRAASAPVTTALISDSLSCLDQVVQWLDAMDVNGEVPANADAGADAVVARFAVVAPPAAPSAPSPAVAPSNWVERLLAAQGDAAPRATAAVRYRPDSACFFRGEDPVGLFEGLPGLLTLDIAAAERWPVLDELDPFACNLVLTALSAAPPEALAAFFERHPGESDIRPLGLASVVAGRDGLSADARLLLDAQILLLAETSQEGAAGRLSSAARVTANVLRHAGLVAPAQRIEQLASRGSTGAETLTSAITAVLAGGAIADTDATEPVEAVAPVDAVARVLRVEVERIDALVNLTGELTVAKNALGHSARLAEADPNAATLAEALKGQHAALERLVNELQASVLGLRVLPLRHVFQRFPRLVREMAADIGKPARLVTEGDATEADKAIVEALFEPLLHMMRNAIDHGVEPRQARAAAGKPEVATVWLRGSRNGEHVLVEVEDDGAGIDVARVRRVAAERGVAPAEALAALTDEAVAELIFAPGFSTAAAVTGLSGRGVGMDSVRASVARLGGRVSLENRPGLGAKVTLTLPFTVMMTRLMTVEAGGQLFGIPMDAVIETARVARDRIVPVGGAQAFVLRNRTVPVIDLANALGEPRSAPTSDVNLVIVALGGEVGGLEVDRLGERLDVMLKPMDGLLSGMPGVAGTTLLGDGRVLIVLDLPELLQ